MRLFGPSEKDQTLRLLKQLTPKCPSCKFYCKSINVTCKTEHDACTIKRQEISPPLEINCKDFESRTKGIDIAICADDGSKIVNNVDLVHIYEEGKIQFLIQREGTDLKSRGEGTIKYYITLHCEK